MKPLIFLACTLLSFLLLLACAGKPTAEASQVSTTRGTDPALPDTTKMKSDVESMISSLSEGKTPDTGRLKKAGSDILVTTANMLSDSGISKITGNSTDPSVLKARALLINMRDSLGITTAKLDSMRKSAETLSANH